ncbi:restriction endonuclease subunit S [Marinomonas primoryensis]|uniref:Type I restriction modification DNA specificity domain-containing protein n=1 Tax=Marinomonas primoryensis TaxID=178399 RepID=A0A859CV73_9GAMM|nr:restriction endonuclease subunit S [Marinomonas primoryensis]QKK79922.1 uncharacterized protein MP3633_1188 [Marinomonas primoryensis]
MSELPKGWVEVEWDQVTTKDGFRRGPFGGNLKKSCFVESGFAIYEQYAPINNDCINFRYFVDDEKYKELQSFKVDNGDFLISCSGTMGKITKVPEGAPKGLINQALLRIRLVESCIDSEYFLKLFRSPILQNQVLNSSVGGAIQNLAAVKELKKILIPLAPLAEQKRIVEKLDQVLAQVDTIKARLDGIPAILKRFRQSVLAAAVSGKLTEEWRGKDEEYIDTCGYKTPSSWLQSSIDEESEYVTSGSRGWAQYYSDTGSLFIRSQDINTDELEIDDAAFVKLPAKVEGQRTKVQKEDLLITITGANVTKCARLKIELDDAYISQHVALIRLKNTEDSSFIELVLKALNAGRKQLTDLAYGGGKPGLNLQNIKDVKFSKPIYKERDEIVRLVDQYFAFADTIEAQVQKAQQRVDKLTQSILAKAFRGELVPQYPTDEPADELLKRIATARKEAEALALSAKKTAKKVGTKNVK